MKKLLLLMTCAIVLFAACSENKTDDADKNTAPTCRITAPLDGASYDRTEPLIIKGRAKDAEDNLSIVKLTVGGEVIKEVTSSPFEYEVAAEKLKKGPLVISLYAEDSKGLNAEEQITISITELAALMTDDDGAPELVAGYWTTERELRVIADTKWTVTMLDDVWFEFFDQATQKWIKKTSISGEGRTSLKIKSIANELFEDKQTELQITTVDELGTFKITQTASPNMLDLFEDELLRMAAAASIAGYGIDKNDDNKISAFEAEIEPAERQPYGFDAGGWMITSTKGIENFPQLRHLDVNAGVMTEINLSKNVNLMSLHIQNCNNLKNLDLSSATKLIELGCNYDIFLSAFPAIKKLKDQIHTLGILNRKPGSASALDFSGFSNLQRLHVNDNGLTELKLTGCNKLWKLVASGNDFTELDMSEVEKYPANQYLMTNCPKLKTIYVWRGFTLDYYDMFRIDAGVNIVEK